ncbi:putative F-box-like domain superfamily protein [Helianthus debilis subsp. tardiflorus]
MNAKRVSKAQGFDLITTLPQAIIETILCLLPIEEAARTSILSRAWRYKWTTIPKLWLCLASVKRPSYMDVPEWWNQLLYEDDVLSDEKPSIMELFKCLPVLEHLTTWGYFIEVLVQASVPEEPPTSLIHLRYVCIEEMCFVDGYGLPFLAVLTRCCPNLEKIKLLNNTAWDDEIESSVLEECSVLLEEYSDVWLEHLNELEIKHFEGRKHKKYGKNPPCWNRAHFLLKSKQSPSEPFS